MEPTNITILPDQRVHVLDHVLMQEIAGQSALLNLKSERYFGLDDVGTQMWTTLTASQSIEQACQTLLDEYEVEPEKLWEDVTNLIRRLVENDLVRLAHE